MRETPTQIARSRGLPVRMADLVGLRIVTTAEMQTGVAVVPAGTMATIEKAVAWSRIHLRCDPCRCCGISLLVVTQIEKIIASRNSVNTSDRRNETAVDMKIE